MHTKYKLGQTNNTPIAIHTSSGYGCRTWQSDFNNRGQIKVADKTVCTVSRYRKARKSKSYGVNSVSLNTSRKMTWKCWNIIQQPSS